MVRVGPGLDADHLRAVVAALEGAAVLSLALPGKVFLCLTPADMRKSFDGALGVGSHRPPAVRSTSGHLFGIWRCHGDRLKILHWDADGTGAVSAKRWNAARSNSPRRRSP